MPLYSVDIEKELDGEYWTNRYIVNSASMAAAESPANEIAAAERAVSLPDVEFTRYRISDFDAGTDAYRIVLLGYNGSRTGTGQGLPLFNVARVDFAVGEGRPSRKYLRGVLAESDQTSYGDLESATIDFINDNYAAVVAAIDEFVDVDGQAVLDGACFPNVGMRQLRRGSRRRTTPPLG